MRTDLAQEPDAPVRELVAVALADAEEFASFALSEGTRDAYRRAYSAYRDRCDQLVVTPLPCPVQDLLAVLGSLARDGRRRPGSASSSPPLGWHIVSPTCQIRRPTSGSSS